MGSFLSKICCCSEIAIYCKSNKGRNNDFLHFRIKLQLQASIFLATQTKKKAWEFGALSAGILGGGTPYENFRRWFKTMIQNEWTLDVISKQKI